MDILGPQFYARDTLAVARELVGMLLVHAPRDGVRLVGRVVETEAYTGDDPACHAAGLVGAEAGDVPLEGRGAELFGAPGTAYVYLCYGIHWMLNVVTEPEGTCGAVLIRAVHPLEGMEVMEQRRSAAQSAVALTNGPGKLAQAFGVDGQLDGKPLTEAPVFFARPVDEPDVEVSTSSRIGITRAVDRPWRFYAEGDPYVSRGTPSNER